MQHSSLVKPVLDLALSAGGIIMRHYNTDFDIEHKDDKSPVTIADKEANQHIIEGLFRIAPEIPIVSEEGVNKPHHPDSRHFWLVDPLDGTKSFIKRTGEFTVNIALIEDKKPILGVVFIPVMGEVYYTGEDGKAYKGLGFRIQDSAKTINHQPSTINQINTRTPPTDGLTIIASKSHRTPETDAYIAKLKVKEFISASSSLKFCMIASGKADCYPRFGTTMEWDTAAGHAVLLAAGGYVEKTDKTPFDYGRSNFTNPHFIAWGKVDDR